MAKTLKIHSYEIRFDPISKSLPEFLNGRKYSSMAVLVDEHTRADCLPLIEDYCKDAMIIEILSGETNKDLSTCEQIWSEMATNRLDRHSLLINLGGGVIGDMGGFAASCYMRGIDFLQIPTTLLSQVDASVGGKLGVDFKGYKNFIGLFNDPQAVLIDPNFLKTLPEKELRSGYAEMIKHALICDANEWELLRNKPWNELDWTEFIARSVEIKKNVVLEDPKEGGLRKVLNFGHTIGHAIESISLEGDKPLLHGEAIALGMMAEASLSAMVSSLRDDELKQIQEYIHGVFGDLDTEVLTNEKRITELMLSDKKNKDGNILFSLLDSIGSCGFDRTVEYEAINDALKQTREYYTLR